MSEEEAVAWVADHVSRETVEKLRAYVAQLMSEATRHNLVSAATIGAIWSRHIVDALQLAPLIGGRSADVGSGAGLPGAVLACAGHDMTLIEPRRLRAHFLERVLKLVNVNAAVIQRDVIKISAAPFDTITARAYAPLTRIFETTVHLAHSDTCWVLPKGRNVAAELEVAKAAWHGTFDIIPSITDPEAAIVVAKQVRAKART